MIYLMPYAHTSFGPRDDWDPQTFSDEDQTTEDLAALGMHTTSSPNDDDDDEDEEDEKEKEVGVITDVDGKDEDEKEEEPDSDEEQVDDLKELERLERALQNDGRDLGEEEE